MKRVRDAGEKGAGMRDQYPHPFQTQQRKEIRSHLQTL